MKISKGEIAHASIDTQPPTAWSIMNTIVRITWVFSVDYLSSAI